MPITQLLMSSASMSTNVTNDDSESSFNACITILNFKKNPHMVLPQTTIYTIIGVYR